MPPIGGMRFVKLLGLAAGVAGVVNENDPRVIEARQRDVSIPDGCYSAEFATIGGVMEARTLDAGLTVDIFIGNKADPSASPVLCRGQRTDRQLKPGAANWRFYIELESASPADPRAPAGAGECRKRLSEFYKSLAKTNDDDYIKASDIFPLKLVWIEASKMYTVTIVELTSGTPMPQSKPDGTCKYIDTSATGGAGSPGIIQSAPSASPDRMDIDHEGSTGGDTAATTTAAEINPHRTSPSTVQQQQQPGETVEPPFTSGGRIPVDAAAAAGSAAGGEGSGVGLRLVVAAAAVAAVAAGLR